MRFSFPPAFPLPYKNTPTATPNLYPLTRIVVAHNYESYTDPSAYPRPLCTMLITLIVVLIMYSVLLTVHHW